MQCVSCGFANPEEMKFCEECGAKLVRACPSCGHVGNPIAKFCGECGAPLMQPSQVQSHKSQDQPPTPNTQHLAPSTPIAHEDHVQRALYAALRMQDEMRRYSDQVRLKHGVPLTLRVGINTGEVVVRSIRKDD